MFTSKSHTTKELKFISEAIVSLEAAIALKKAEKELEQEVEDARLKLTQLKKELAEL